MPINLRSGSSVIPDGSITEAKLANDSVSTAKIQTNAVIDTKIATDAVTTSKIAADAVTKDKTNREVVTQHYFGTEQEFYHTGDTETSIADFNFTTSTDIAENWKSLSWSGKLKSSNVSNDATMKIYIDTVLYNSKTSNSTSYDLVADDNIDISALTAGTHHVEIKLVNSINTETTTVGQLDIYFSKK